MSSTSWLTRLRVTLLLSLVATAWAGSVGNYAEAALFGCATLVTLAIAIVRGARQASAVIAGADQMIEDQRRLTRLTESSLLRSTSTSA